VVRDARQDGVCAINLLQGDDEHHLVLEGEGTQGPEKVSALTHPFREPIRPAHQQRASLARIAFDSLNLFCERAAGELFPAAIEHEPKATLAATQQLAAFVHRIGGLDMRGVHRGKAP
jgi:hypothetical protein